MDTLFKGKLDVEMYNESMTLKTKRLCLSSESKPFGENQDSLSSLKNIYNIEQAKGSGKHSSRKKSSKGHETNPQAAQARQRLPELTAIKHCHEYVIEKKLIYRCTNCGYSFVLQSKSLNLAVKRCGRCTSTCELMVNSKAKDPKNPGSSVPRTPRKPTCFALFVKENYRSVKDTHAHLEYKKIMQLIGQLYSQVKTTSCYMKELPDVE